MTKRYWITFWIVWATSLVGLLWFNNMVFEAFDHHPLAGLVIVDCFFLGYYFKDTFDRAIHWIAKHR